jgi:sulfur carrier protein
MKLVVNGEKREIAGVRTIDELLRALAVPLERGGIAVAWNDRVVARGQWSETTLSEGDRLEIIHAVQGG